MPGVRKGWFVRNTECWQCTRSTGQTRECGVFPSPDFRGKNGGGGGARTRTRYIRRAYAMYTLSLRHPNVMQRASFKSEVNFSGTKR
jgi:NaMN:DMB phosphoribosyltransferase